MLEAILLGVVEGLTEFLPISSTGHLLIVEHWLERRSDLFNVAIQLGAILAVSLVYRGRIAALLTSWRDRARRDYLLKLAASFLITAVLGYLIVKLGGAELPKTVTPIAWALIAGGLVIFIAEYYVRHRSPAEHVTWKAVVAVGVAQVIAGIFPGTSRSAAAIFAAMFAGLGSRPRAAEFAFLVGIPTMLTASGFELVKSLSGAGAAAENWPQLVVAFLVAAGVGFASVKWLLAYISRHSFVVFGWYRIALGVVLLLVLR